MKDHNCAAADPVSTALETFEVYLYDFRNRTPAALPPEDNLIDALACVSALWNTGSVDEAEIELKSFGRDGNPFGYMSDVEHMLATWPATDVPEFESFRRHGLDILLDATGGTGFLDPM